MIPKYFFLTKGEGKHKDYLHSFELSLRDAGIQHLNIVQVSSIVPPTCKQVSKEQGLKMLKPGEITFAVLDINSTDEPQKTITSSIGVALPPNKRDYGYIAEHHSSERKKVTEEFVEELASTMLTTALGIHIDADKSWKTRKELLVAKGITTFNITQSSEGTNDSLWRTVIAAAVFIL
ncbi:MAG: arginine decarboxylase, pyruvoyl-dependent [Candidatus Bathyarchaeota archaeon]|jgi:arginine decarboxylase